MSLFVDFAGLNFLIQDAITSSANYIGYPLGSTVSSYYNDKFSLSNTNDYLVALNLHRNGPYGYSTFRQVRVSHNNLSRYQRNNNSFSIVNQPSETVNISKGAGDINFVTSRYGEVEQYTEMPVISRYKPLQFKFGVGIDNPRIENKQGPLSVPNIENVILFDSFGNEKNHFSSENLNRKLGLNELTDEEYEVIKDFYLDGGLDSDDSPISTFIYLKYRENLYPRESNMYRAHIRQRTNYANNFWRFSRTDRSTTVDFDFNSSGFDGSMWNIDGPSSWPTVATATSPTDTFIYKSGRLQSNGAGILQNNQSIFFAQKTAVTPNKLYPYPIYNRQHALFHSRSVVAPSGIAIDETGSSDSHITDTDGSGPLFGGFAAWEAGDQSGLVPFYNTIDEFYSEDLRVKYKDYSILPEYRSSRFMNEYYDSGSGEYVPQGFLEVSGGLDGNSLSNEEDFFNVYSTTEFFRDFATLKKDHKGFVDPSMISITCKAIKKFIPYNSFYPSQRTVDLANEFWSSYSQFVSSSISSSVFGDQEYGKLNFMVPLFAPGVLFNSIKAGVACDYPLSSQTSSVSENQVFSVSRDADAGTGLKQHFIGGEFDKRIPFEALIEPQNYLKDLKIINQEPHPSGSAANGAAQWSGGGRTVYNIMASNFCAEVADFYLGDGTFTGLRSLPQGNNRFGNMTNGKVYSMRVKMYRSMTGPNLSVVSENAPSGLNYNTADYFYIPPQDISEGPNTGFFDDGQAPRETITMYSRPSAFGPAVCARLGSAASFRPNLSASSANGYNFPFTPPYYHGQSWAHIYYTASADGKHTLDEILSEATVRYYRVDPASWRDTERESGGNNAQSGSMGVDTTLTVDNYHIQRINTNAMQLSASVNLFNILDTSGVRPRPGNDPTVSSQESRWIIQTKFETPILNFKNVSLTASTRDAQTPRGMWHQYGQDPRGDEGIYLEVEDIPDSWHIGAEGQNPETVKNTYESLADVCGFTKKPIALGDIRDQKEVSEAIVAIPFTELNGEKKFFELEGLNGSAGVLDMVNKMRKYILPPQFDFVRNSNITPFTMYIFEFFHQFDREDLKNMWQGLYPKISREFEEATTSISHPLLAKELLGTGIKGDNRKIGSTLPDKIRWMVFKIKRRANHNYFSKIVGSNKEPLGFNQDVTPNWPYDYFSFIELAKINGEIKFSEISQKGRIVSDVALGDSINEKSTRTEIRSESDGPSGIVVATGGDPNAGVLYDDSPDVPGPKPDLEDFVPPGREENIFNPADPTSGATGTDEGPDDNDSSSTTSFDTSDI